MKHESASCAQMDVAVQPSADNTAEGAFRLLIPELRRALVAVGYQSPTDVQEQSIPHVLQGRDLLSSAPTGTGKSAAFTLPLLQRLTQLARRPQRGTPRALILAPTRELAAQIGEGVRSYGRNLRISHSVIFGGVNQSSQVRALHRGVDILVATPGRLLDLMEQGYIDLGSIEYFVLDEVDRMLDMGFLPAIKRVIAKIPKRRQTLFFSATLPPKMTALAQTLVQNPVRVTVQTDEPSVDRIAQQVMFVGKKNKNALLVSMLGGPEIQKAVIFTQMKHVANRVVKELESAGIRGVAIHGNKSQAARTKALDGFKRGRFRVLVATDVAARGLDVDDITHVINYDLPVEAETYVHRIGRTARAGASGDAISFCSAEERAYLKDIDRLMGEPVPRTLDHGYHCDDAFHSTQPKERFGGSQRQPRSANRFNGRRRDSRRGRR